MWRAKEKRGDTDRREEEWGRRESGRWGVGGDAEREKENTCGRHYSVGQGTVVLHGAFC